MPWASQGAVVVNAIFILGSIYYAVKTFAPNTLALEAQRQLGLADRDPPHIDAAALPAELEMVEISADDLSGAVTFPAITEAKQDDGLEPENAGKKSNGARLSKFIIE